jgi:hypothetical protein
VVHGPKPPLHRHNLLTFGKFQDTESFFYRIFIFPCSSRAKFWALATSMKLSVLFWLLDLGESAGLLRRVISSSQGLCDCDDDGEVNGVNGFGRGNRSTRRKPAPTPLGPPQIPLARPWREPVPPRWEASD